MKVTAETITDAQIRVLRDECGVFGTGEQMIVRCCNIALGDFDASFPILPEQRQESIERARAACAHAINARNEALS